MLAGGSALVRVQFLPDQVEPLARLANALFGGTRALPVPVPVSGEDAEVSRPLALVA